MAKPTVPGKPAAKKPMPTQSNKGGAVRGQARAAAVRNTNAAKRGK